MRLSDVLSKPIDLEFKQVEGFLDNRKLKEGKSKKLLIGKVALTYFCAKCDSDLSFVSKEDIFGIGVNNKQISVDCVLTCPRCGNQLPVWFLVESANEIHNIYPEVRVLKRTEKFNPTVIFKVMPSFLLRFYAYYNRHLCKIFQWRKYGNLW